MENKELKFKVGSDNRGKGLVRENEQAILVALILPNQNEEQTTEYLDELEFLALTAGAETIKRITQRLPHPDNRHYVGKGKVEEILQYIQTHEGVTMVIFDDDLSPKQQGILEEALKVKILDRSTLIIDIFARRAQTAQAKAQVELAQLQYLLPRLRGLWSHLERQKGGIGMWQPLRYPFDGLRACGEGQKFEFIEVFSRLFFVLIGQNEGNQNRLFGFLNNAFASIVGADLKFIFFTLQNNSDI